MESLNINTEMTKITSKKPIKHKDKESGKINNAGRATHNTGIKQLGAVASLNTSINIMKTKRILSNTIHSAVTNLGVFEPFFLYKKVIKQNVMDTGKKIKCWGEAFQFFIMNGVKKRKSISNITVAKQSFSNIRIFSFAIWHSSFLK